MTKSDIKKLKQIIDSGLDVGSGVLTATDPNIDVRLNKFGEYVSVVSGNIKDLTPKLSIMSNMVDNESTIAKDLFSSIPNIKRDKIIGYYTNLYAGHTTISDIRDNASSGGLTTWILKELMERGLIDGVIHVAERSSTPQEPLVRS